jgi:hypothetical protein
MTSRVCDLCNNTLPKYSSLASHISGDNNDCSFFSSIVDHDDDDAKESKLLMSELRNLFNSYAPVSSVENKSKNFIFYIFFQFLLKTILLKC